MEGERTRQRAHPRKILWDGVEEHMKTFVFSDKSMHGLEKNGGRKSRD